MAPQHPQLDVPEQLTPTLGGYRRLRRHRVDELYRLGPGESIPAACAKGDAEKR